MNANDQSKPTEKPTAVQDINWGDFRDHLATADKEGHRMWVYPKKPKGRFYLARLYFTFALLVIMFGGPFIKIHGNPLLMINVVERKFSVLGVIFWPQDNLIFAFGFLLFLTGIAVFTAAFGRLWCGWTCPQTVMMEMVFRRLEYFIEGDAHQQRALELVDTLRRERGITVVSAMHDLTLAGLYSDRLALLHHGHCVASGAADEVLKADTLSEFYGVAVSVHREPDGTVVVIPRRTAPLA